MGHADGLEAALVMLLLLMLVIAGLFAIYPLANHRVGQALFNEELELSGGFTPGWG
ncbi:hypothetical protein LP417_15560 [Polaromonas sp. P1-6]|nr:hypothetical protein LP417_15560 [Polaromonas sp. P1-6]